MTNADLHPLIAAIDHLAMPHARAELHAPAAIIRHLDAARDRLDRLDPDLRDRVGAGPFLGFLLRTIQPATSTPVLAATA